MLNRQVGTYVNKNCGKLVTDYSKTTVDTFSDLSSHSSHDPAQPLAIQPCTGCGGERYILKERFEFNRFISQVVLRWLVETSTGRSRDVAHLSLHPPLPSGVVLFFTVNLGIPGQFLLSHTYCVCMCTRPVYIRGQYTLCVRGSA